MSTQYESGESANKSPYEIALLHGQEENLKQPVPIAPPAKAEPVAPSYVSGESHIKSLFELMQNAGVSEQLTQPALPKTVQPTVAPEPAGVAADDFKSPAEKAAVKGAAA